MFVWADPECGASDDTNACDGGYAGCSNPSVQAGAVLLGRIEIPGFQAGSERMKAKAEAKNWWQSAVRQVVPSLPRWSRKKSREAPDLV